jgi:alkanesulfonate monooxygenase SsuD/methylene tetrahydromethanopterin reductase-like flavin-dependent oxidoreductase (luciferase family)
VEEPALDAWSTAAALAAVTSSLELMVAVARTSTSRPCSPSRRRTSTISAAAGLR